LIKNVNGKVCIIEKMIGNYILMIFVGATVKDLLIDSRHYIVSTFKQMKSIKQLLLLPLAFWVGTFLGFVFAIFTSVTIIESVSFK
jgi:hypothetical protein